MKLDPDLQRYIEGHIMPQEDFLYELERESHFKSVYPRMVCGHLQGKILYMLCRMIKPKRVLELGTFTGYSAICMALALDEGALLHTIELNDEMEGIIRKYMGKAGVDHKTVLHFGDALHLIPTIDEKFDLVYLDANKRDYPAYYTTIFDKVKTGGYILADNTLWDGKVCKGSDETHDPQTLGIRAFNDMIKNDNRVENVIFPIRDGMTIIRKVC
jgi:caffeoyl-CoA O-methyltransferase